MKYIIILHKNNREYVVEQYPNLIISTDDNTKDNIIHIEEGVRFLEKSEFCLRSIRGNFSFHSNSIFEHVKLHTGPGCFEQNLHIGKNNYFEKNLEIILNNDFVSCAIGDNCYFERNVELWGGDGHTIIDKSSMHATNCSEFTIRIADEVFVGHNTILLKKASIGKGILVNCNSTITKSFFDRQDALLSGSPAKIVHEGIKWKRKRNYGA